MYTRTPECHREVTHLRARILPLQNKKNKLSCPMRLRSSVEKAVFSL